MNKIENVLEENLERAFPQFGIDVDILENTINDSDGVNFVFNISKKSDNNKQDNNEESLVPQLEIFLDGTEEEASFFSKNPPAISPLGIDVDVHSISNTTEAEETPLDPNLGIDIDAKDNEHISESKDFKFNKSPSDIVINGQENEVDNVAIKFPWKPTKIKANKFKSSRKQENNYKPISPSIRYNNKRKTARKASKSSLSSLDIALLNP